jgi:hypothetical protein
MRHGLVCFALWFLLVVPPTRAELAVTARMLAANPAVRVDEFADRSSSV